MGCERQASVGEFLSELRATLNQGEIVLVGAQKEDIVRAWRQMATAFGDSLHNMTDEQVFRVAASNFNVQVSNQIYSVGPEYETSTSIFKDWVDSRKLSVFYSLYRNEHDDQQARIRAQQKRERMNSVPDTGKKIPRRRFM